MLRKYALIASVLAALGTPSAAKAQTTMDVAMKIQAILDQLSEIRSGLKQVQSSMNIETMLQNLGGNGDWKAMLKNAAGGIFDKNAEKGGTKQALLLLPEGLAEKADDVDAAADWMKENLFLQKENVSMSERDELNKQRIEFKYTALASGYGKAVATRKQLDKDLASIEKLRQDAESKESETDLQNEINKIALLKLEQANYQQLLMATRSHVEGASDLLNVSQKSNVISDGESQEEAGKGEGTEKEKSKLEQTIDNVKDKVDAAKDKVEEQVDKVKDKVDAAKDKVEEQVDKVKDKVDAAKDKVEEQVDKAKGKVNDAVKQASAKISGGKSSESDG